MIDIGATADFAAYPAAVEIDGEPYFLIQTDESYQLLSRICPHAGGIIMEAESEFYCPYHYWEFSKDTGCASYPPNAKMQSVDVIEQNGRLFAQIELPDFETQPLD